MRWSFTGAAGGAGADAASAGGASLAEAAASGGAGDGGDATADAGAPVLDAPALAGTSALIGSPDRGSWSCARSFAVHHTLRARRARCGIAGARRVDTAT